MRDRLSGLDGSWKRRQRADVERYPIFKQQSFQANNSKESVDDIRGLTRARGEIRYLDAGPVAAECADFKAALEKSRASFVEAFLTAPSPGMVSAIVLNEHYPSEEAYLAALGGGPARRVRDHRRQRTSCCSSTARIWRASGTTPIRTRPLEDFLGFAGRVIDAINHALRNIPRERVRMHVCWGNYEGPHDCDVPLEDVIPVMRRAKVGGFVLPFANPRHAHEFRYVKDLLVDDEQTIVAGVIDTTTNFVEHPEVVADRLERVAAVVGDPRRVMAGTDCGFESIAGKGRVAEDVAWAKLAALSEGARLASSRLF